MMGVELEMVGDVVDIMGLPSPSNQSVYPDSSCRLEYDFDWSNAFGWS
jgi:hypothetical protein